MVVRETTTIGDGSHWKEEGMPFLYAVTRSPREAFPLTLEEEAALGSWIKGTASEGEIRLAKGCIRKNRRAKDYIMARQIEISASKGPNVSEKTTNAVFKNLEQKYEVHSESGFSFLFSNRKNAFGLVSAASLAMATLVFVILSQDTARPKFDLANVEVLTEGQPVYRNLIVGPTADDYLGSGSVRIVRGNAETGTLVYGWPGVDLGYSQPDTSTGMLMEEVLPDALSFYPLLVPVSVLNALTLSEGKAREEQLSQMLIELSEYLPEAGDQETERLLALDPRETMRSLLRDSELVIFDRRLSERVKLLLGSGGTISIRIYGLTASENESLRNALNVEGRTKALFIALSQ